MTAPMTPAALTARRHALGLTQAAMADRLGVTARTLQRWEAGTIKINKRTAQVVEGMK